MNVVKNYKIGKVSIKQLEGADIDSSRYSDGDSEDFLLKLFKSKDAENQVYKALATDLEWPVYYHLSPFRKNVVDWFSFKKNASVLEIGAGCGAITEALLKQDVDVTAVELTKRRAEINAHRNKSKKNLNIILGNLEDFEPEHKFDYVVCVGVLEYAGMFINDSEPYNKFLEKVRDFLKPDGQMILAIENRMGLKYFSGAREDHTGRFFDGINQYPHPKKVKTFGKKELSDLVLGSDFKHIEFFYPFPDYKNPQFVYSQCYHPGKGTSFPVKSLPVPGFDENIRKRVHIFNEQLAMLSIEDNELFEDFSNSFILIAGVSKDTKPATNHFFIDNPLRKKQFQLKTTARQTSNGMVFSKHAQQEASKDHLNKLVDNYPLLSKIFNDKNTNVTKPTMVSGAVEFPGITGETLERLLLKCIVEGKNESFIEYIDRYIELVNKLPGQEYTDLLFIDLNFDNIIVNNKWHLIDYEWLFDKRVNKSVLITRALLYFLNRHKYSLRTLSKRGDYVDIADDLCMPHFIYERYKVYLQNIEEFKEIETWFLSFVNSNFKTHKLLGINLHNEPIPSTPPTGFVEQYFERDIKAKAFEKQRKEIEQLQQVLNSQALRLRKAELTSVYYLPAKILKKLRKLH